MRTALFVVATFVSASCVGWGQTGFGEIAGRVTDPTGAGIPSASLKAVNVATGETSRTVSSVTGDYEFLRLSPGEYTVVAETAGFKTLDHPGVVVRVADRITLNLQLELGQTSERVNVTAEAPLLRTQDAQTGDVIDQSAIMNLPVLDHDPLELVRLSSDFQGSGNKNDPENRINGGRPVGMEYFVDGIAVEKGMSHSTVDDTPTMQGTDEFKVVTNGISAEYGRMSGGFVEIVTKSGTNEYHGQLFEYDQNRVFNANSWGQNYLGNSKPLFQYNLFGGAVGGPVSIPHIYNGHNKTFFFFDYQGTRFNTAGVAQTGSFPTQAMRNGDLSGVQVNGVPAMLYDQSSPLVCSTTGKPYDNTCTFDGSAADAAGDLTQGPIRTGLIGDGTHVPTSFIDPVSAAIMKLLPLPNRPADANCSYCNDYIGKTSSNYHDNRYSTRIDEMLTDNQRLFGRFGYQDYTNNGNTRWWGPLQAPNISKINGGSNLTLDYVWTTSPTTVIEARGAYYFNPNFSGSSVEPSAIDQVPLNSLMRTLMGPTTLPWTVVPNMGVGNALIDNANNGVTNSTAYQADLSVSKILQRHTLKFGYEHRRYYDNFLASGSAWMIADGDSVNRVAVDNPWEPQSFANDFGAFLMGQADHVQANGYTTSALNYNYHAAFVQDDFKVSPKLTLNLGLRWEMETPITERHNKLFFWDPNAASPFTFASGYNWNAALTAAGVNPSSVPEPSWASSGQFPKGAIVAAGSPQHPSRYGPGYNPLQFAPRLGAAYQLTPSTVVRGSVGEMYLSASGNSGALQSGGIGFVTANAITPMWHYPTTLPVYDSLTFSQPTNNPNQIITFTPGDSTQANFQQTGGSAYPVVYALNTHQPREWDWNFSVQRQLSGNFLVEAQYNGNRGVGLFIPDDISRFPANLFTGGSTASSLYATNVLSPIGNATDTKWYTGSGPTTEQLAFLEYPYPQYGPVRIMGANQGRSQYNAFVIRVEKRMSKGISFISSYTLSRMMDDTGGPNVGADVTNSSGTGGRDVQSVDLMKNFYTVSPIDHTHRLVFAGNVDLPFGRGRKWLGHPNGYGGKFVDGVAGGWQLAGIYTWVSGAPVVLGFANGQTNNGTGHIINTWGSWTSADQNLSSSSFSNNNAVFVETGNVTTNPSVSRFNSGAVTDAQPFVYGNLNPIEPGIREPGTFNTDLSLMKDFPFSAEGKRFLQLRVEASNAWNQRGYPTYSATVGSPGFGLLVADPNNPWRQPRILQLSGRIVF